MCEGMKGVRKEREETKGEKLCGWDKSGGKSEGGETGSVKGEKQGRLIRE